MKPIHSIIFLSLFWSILPLHGQILPKPLAKPIIQEVVVAAYQPSDMSRADFDDQMTQTMLGIKKRLDLLMFPIQKMERQGDRITVQYKVDIEKWNRPDSIFQPIFIDFREAWGFSTGYEELMKINERIKSMVTEDPKLLEKADLLTGDESPEVLNFVKDYPMFIDFSFPQQAELESNPLTPTMGYMELEDTWKMDYWLGSDLAQKAKSRGVEFVWGQILSMSNGIAYRPLLALKTRDLQTVELTGQFIKEAKSGFPTGSDDPVIEVHFDMEGTKRLRNLTTANEGYAMCIMVNDEVLMYPQIGSPIIDGVVQITCLSFEECLILEFKLNSHLPLVLKIVESRIVE